MSFAQDLNLYCCIQINQFNLAMRVFCRFPDSNPQMNSSLW